MNDIIQNLLAGDHIEVWSVTISQLSWWLGLLFIIMGVLKMTQEQRYQGRQSSMVTMGSLSIFAGVFLMSFEAFIETLTETIFGVPWTSDFDFTNSGAVEIANTFTPPNNAGPEIIYVELAVYIIQLVGLLAIIRGVILFKQSHQNSQNMFGAGWHVFGGVIGLNFVTFMNVVGQSTGPTVQSVVDRLFG